MRIIAIDPSINTIGTAVWTDGELETHTIRTRLPAKGPVGEKKVALAKQLSILLSSRLIGGVAVADALIIEYPNFQTSTRGLIAAQMGYTLDLAFVAGFVASQIPHKLLLLPTPNGWKGQQRKEIVGQRFTNWTGIDYRKVSDHEYEAAMMCHWAIRTGKVTVSLPSG